MPHNSIVEQRPLACMFNGDQKDIGCYLSLTVFAGTYGFSEEGLGQSLQRQGRR